MEQEITIYKIYLSKRVRSWQKPDLDLDEEMKRLEKILDDIPGSGHPTVHPDGRHILTDAYTFESLSYGDGTVPIRFIDLDKGEDRRIIRIETDTKRETGLRVDPHPAWDPGYRWIAFNGYTDGTRRVFIADLSSLL